MPEFNILSPSEQVAAYLREELTRGRWSGQMPSFYAYFFLSNRSYQ